MERYVIHVTKECNMKCLYCYEKDKLSTYLWSEIEKLIDNIILNNTEDKYSVEFLGGEPLLEFEYVRDAIAYFKSNDPDHVDHFIITSNGTILTDAIIDLLKANEEVFYSVSLDGTKTMNQLRTMVSTGENSYDRVIANIERALLELSADRLGVHMVIHPFNVSSLRDGIHHLYDKGVRHIGVGTVESTIEIDSVYARRFTRELAFVSEEMSKGELPGVHIDLFDYLKPQADVRKYIKDPVTGKVLGESYGRAAGDITTIDEYDTVSTSSAMGDFIYKLRETVYLNHQQFMSKKV